MGWKPSRSVLWIASLAAVIAAGCRSEPPAPAPAPVALDAAPPMDPETAAKLTAFREVLAMVDGTLHAHRLAYRAEWREYAEWGWPSWLPPDELEARLVALEALARDAPALPADQPAIRYVAVVRAIVPTWLAAHEAWQQGADAYGAQVVAVRASFEQLGQASAAFRAAVPDATPAAGSWPEMAQLCLAGAAIGARAAVPAPVDGVEAELERSSVYEQLLDGELRIAGLRCAHAALELLDQASGADVWTAQQGVQLGMFLVTEEERRAGRTSYVSGLVNYAQFAVLMFHDAMRHP